MKSQWLEPDVPKGTSPVLRGGRPGNKFFLTRPISHIKLSIKSKAKYVLDADISRCFDRINHEALLQKLNTRGKVRKQIKSWLKSGVIDKGAFTATSEGTPQGGIISPLLANIALHGLEHCLKNFAETLDIKDPSHGRQMSRSNKKQSLTIIRSTATIGYSQPVKEERTPFGYSTIVRLVAVALTM